MTTGDIIVAPATATGGAIAIIRVSGEGCIELCDRIFRARKGTLTTTPSHTLRYGEIIDSEEVVDDVLVSVFRAPHSYTSEDSVEISCHGSSYITRQIISLLLRAGARTADAGEFTTRAYLAGKMDLSQAEAVADIIASTSKAQHIIATTQMRGEYSSQLASLRAKLVETAALLELELDFSEEEVEFADRTHLDELMQQILIEIERLAETFAVGNAIKNGVPVAIIGSPNVGKSTLLNRLLGDERAMVSDIAGTTRDLIEEQIVIDGISYRFIDTAGVHQTSDKLEQMGIERTLSAIERAQIIIHLTSAENLSQPSEIDNIELRPDQRVIKVINKIDISNIEMIALDEATIKISAKESVGIENLIAELSAHIDKSALLAGAPIVSGARHYELLTRAADSLSRAKEALSAGVPTDLLCQDLRQTLHHIGAITSTITTTDLLSEIFSKFCVGK